MSYDNWKLDYPAHYDFEGNWCEECDIEIDDNSETLCEGCQEEEAPLVEKAIIRKGAISLKWTDGKFSHYYPNVRSMPEGMFRQMRAE